MKVPVGWLADFLELPTTDPQELEKILVSLGHEVEGIEHITPSFSGVVVGRVEEVGPHPNANRIRFCRVYDGSETFDVVCGAWNFTEGAIVAYARVGSVLGADSDQPTQVGAREIRGVVSHGMIASARELGLGDEHEGILVLDELGAASSADLGRDFAQVAGISEVVLDVAITPNRGDCMSIRGLARELSAFWEIPLRDVNPQPRCGDQPARVSVTIQDSQACPRFVGHEIDGVQVGPSPLWMQLRLLAIGQRPIANVVDVSNYVMWELGHPIHTFDAGKVTDRQIIIRRAQAGETLRTLDGVDRDLEESDILVTDPSGPIALAGVMGGASTEVSADSTDILVEAANWHPFSILSTSHRLGLRSEASTRFERGVDPNLSALAVARAVELIATTGGGVPRASAVDCYPSPREPGQVRLQERDVSRLLGPQPDFARSQSLLTRLGFVVSPANDDGSAVDVRIPTFRSDVSRPADLVEEIARLYGFDRFDNRVRRGVDGRLTPRQFSEHRLHEVLVGAGLSEAHTLSFVSQASLDSLTVPFMVPGIDRPSASRNGIRIKNPLREQEAVLRTTLIPGLVEAVVRNVSRGISQEALFEIGRVFWPVADPGDPRIPFQPLHLGIILAGPHADVYAGTALVELLSETGLHPLSLSQERIDTLHPGRGAEVICEGEVIGFMGELHPVAVRGAGLTGRVVVAELAVDPLLAQVPDWVFQQVSMFPPLVFDLAFILAEEMPATRLLSTVRSAAGAQLEEVEIFDEYRGDPIPPGHRSLAVRITLRDMDHTLTDEEAAPILNRIAQAVAEKLGGKLRGPQG